jgi:hypothetical protein
MTEKSAHRRSPGEEAPGAIRMSRRVREVTGLAFDIVLRSSENRKNDEPALVSAVDGAGSAMLFSVAAAI